MKDFDEMMRNALTPSDEPDINLNQKIINQVRRKKNMKTSWFRRMPAAAAAMVIVLLVGSVSVYAAWRLLSPQEVAKEFNDQSLEKAFEDNEITDVETQSYKGYEITLLGLISGDKLSDYGYTTKEDGSIISDNTYSLVAIRREDGKDISDEKFLASPYIKGEAPWEVNIFFMGGGKTSTIKDGVLYWIVNCENLECFADQGVYLGVTDGGFPVRDAFLYNNETGEISRNEEYDGINALFRLPFDTSKANPQKAAELLEKWETEADSETDDMSEEDTADAEKRMSEKWDGDRVKQNAEIIEETIRTIPAGEDGNYHFSWDYQGELGGEATFYHDNDIFMEASPGELVVEFFTIADESDTEKLIFVTYTKNEDGTITAACYKEK